MLPLFDMMKAFDDGRAFDLLARQYNLTRQQAELAVEALLPAFGEALKRQAGDASGQGLFSAMAETQRRAIDDWTKAFTPAGAADGSAVLRRFFPSPELVGALTSEAARISGVGQDILAKMMPSIAAMLAGGLAGRAAKADRAGPEADPFKVWDAGANPYFRAMQEAFAAIPASIPASSRSNPANSEPPPATKNDPFADLVGRMFETGEEYRKTVAQLFDRFGRTG